MVTDVRCEQCGTGGPLIRTSRYEADYGAWIAADVCADCRADLEVTGRYIADEGERRRESMSPAMLLRRGADIVEKSGRWGLPREGKTCADLVLGELSARSPIGNYEIARAALSSVVGPIWEFNDRQGQTAKKVASAMRRAVWYLPVKYRPHPKAV